MAESEEEHQSNLMKVKKETEKLVLTQYSKTEDHGIWSHHLMENDGGNWEILFSWAPKSLQILTAAMKLKDPYTLEEKPRQHIKKQRHYLGNKVPYSQSCGLTSSFILMQQLDHKEGWS